jgi:hypothetical protein
MRQPPDKSLLREWLAKTPGVQTRERAIASVKARRARLLAQPPADTRRDDEIATPEPVPSIEQPDVYDAAGFWKRQAARDEAKKRPPRGKKPRLVIDNEEPPKKR